MRKQINISDFYPTTIVTRDSIVVLREQLELVGQKDILFNFENIEFISRSFADEFVNLIEKNKLNVEFRFNNQTVSEIINIVIKNRKNKSRNFQQIPTTRITSQNQLENFLALL